MVRKSPGRGLTTANAARMQMIKVSLNCIVVAEQKLTDWTRLAHISQNSQLYGFNSSQNVLQRYGFLDLTFLRQHLEMPAKFPAKRSNITDITGGKCRYRNIATRVQQVIHLTLGLPEMYRSLGVRHKGNSLCSGKKP